MKRGVFERPPGPVRADAEVAVVRAPRAAKPIRSPEALLHELQIHQMELEVQNEALREALTALTESRDDYAELYDFAPVGYLTLGESGQIVKANLAAAALLGIERRELCARRFDHFIAPPDRDAWQLLLGSMKQGAKGQSLETSLQQGNGSWVLVHLNCRAEESGDVPSKLRIAITDLSERAQMEQQLRDSEALFRSIFDNSLDAILLTGPNDSVLAANAEAQRLFGYSNEELRVLGQRGVADTSDPRYEAAIAQREREGWFRGELTLIGRGAIKFPAELSSSVIARRDGGRLATLVVRDISERIREACGLHQARREAEQANNAKSRFLAAASHDLRQPLSALSLYLNVLKSHVGASGVPVLANIKDCIRSLSELLTDLLDLSKLEAGVVTAKPSHFSFDALLTTLVSVHIPEAESKGLSLRCAASTQIGYTDPVLFQRILGNLISNAIRYTDKGGVLVGCRRSQGKTWVEVWDTGIGIAPDRTTEIFEEFRQLDDGARTRGSGLGLAIVARTADVLGIQVCVRSRPGRGSVFAVELPLGQRQERPTPARCESLHRSLSLALVDDNPMVRQALSQALKNAGHQVVVAATGEELGAQLGDRTLDVVISDYRLPHGETGFDVITRVRATFGADVPAILITGDTDPEVVRVMADRGIVVLHKPLDMESLETVLEELTC